MEEPRLEWSAAAVRDGTLTVELAGDAPRGWKPTFRRTAKLLGGGDWGEVSVRGTKVKVADVADGTEEELRFLESVVQQANATHVQSEDDAEDEADDGDETDEGDDADARMTARFRDFGAT